MIKYPGTTVYKDVVGRVIAPPAVSILLHLHPVFSAGADSQYRLKIALANVRNRLLKNYPAATVIAVIARLEKLQMQIKADMSHKSIALFASPTKSSLYYLDTYVEERITIGDSFSVRDLVADSKQLRDYLILLLSDKECRFYLAGEHKLEPLKTETPAEVFAYANEKPERVANFSDPGDRKEIVMDKFLHHMDQELTRILATHPLPIFVLGPEKVVGHFKTHSRHLAQIAGYAHGNYLESSEEELRRIAQPCLGTWQMHNRRTLLDRLETEAGDKKLSIGMRDAWAAASHGKGRLLVVEKSYRFPARRGDSADQLVSEDNPEDNPPDIPDAVDDLIGQVISKGGDVAFVDDGDLKEYEHIALIRYY